MAQRVVREISADRCPWPKPFPEGFDDCPAFQQTHFIPLDSQYHPLEPVLSCRHLVIRQQPGMASRWYAACEIGDAEARRRWAVDVDEEWLHRLAVLRAQMEGINRPFVQRIWKAKAAQLAARQTGDPGVAATQELRQLADQFVRQSRDFIAAHASEFADLQLAPEAIIELLHSSLTHFIEMRSTDARWEIPEDLLTRFPEPVQKFFRPRLTRA